jgi:hypothetical protein
MFGGGKLEAHFAHATEAKLQSGNYLLHEWKPIWSQG